MSHNVRDKMQDGCNFESNLNQAKHFIFFKKHSPVILLISEALHFHQYSADFTYFVPIARELFFTPLVDISRE